MIRIEVTQEDIDKGQRQTCRYCPVALAIKRAFPEKVHEIRVGAFQFLTDDKWLEIPAPTILKFILAFDDGRSVKPFSFEVPEISEWKEYQP